VIRNLLALSPPTLPDTPPIEYVEAAAAAGYDAVGLRLARSPLFPFYPVVGNPPLIRELKLILASSGLSVLDILTFYCSPRPTSMRSPRRWSSGPSSAHATRSSRATTRSGRACVTARRASATWPRSSDFPRRSSSR